MHTDIPIRKKGDREHSNMDATSRRRISEIYLIVSAQIGGTNSHSTDLSQSLYRHIRIRIVWRRMSVARFTDDFSPDKAILPGETFVIVEWNQC